MSHNLSTTIKHSETGCPATKKKSKFHRFFSFGLCDSPSVTKNGFRWMYSCPQSVGKKFSPKNDSNAEEYTVYMEEREKENSFITRRKRQGSFLLHWLFPTSNNSRENVNCQATENVSLKTLSHPQNETQLSAFVRSLFRVSYSLAANSHCAWHVVLCKKNGTEETIKRQYFLG